VLNTFEFVAVITATLFAGASLYINVVEHPARMLQSTREAAQQWAPSYKRATWLQAPLALISGLSGVAAWFLGGGGLWLVGAVLIAAVVPFTFAVIMPTNNQLLSAGRDLGSEETRGLLVRWGNLHAVRTLLSLCAAGLFSWLIVWA
jgi:hypothetical protein